MTGLHTRLTQEDPVSRDKKLSGRDKPPYHRKTVQGASRTFMCGPGVTGAAQRYPHAEKNRNLPWRAGAGFQPPRGLLRRASRAGVRASRLHSSLSQRLTQTRSVGLSDASISTMSPATCLDLLDREMKRLFTSTP
ncbi:hypothetical protein OKW45_005122 [Paraburkholderia sp. WSM4175]